MAPKRLRAVLTLTAFGITACAGTQNPVTGQKEFTTVSRAQEQKIGDETHPEILESFGGAYADPRVSGYVNAVGQRLAAQSHLAGQQNFTFTVLDTPTVNAFALPGGYVYITRGILALAQDESQMAGVLGHEIGHVTARHSAQRQTRSTLAGLGTLAATIGAAALGAGGTTARQIGQLAGTAGKGVVAQYSQRQELEADTLGVEYSARNGYDPFALGEFLDIMKAQQALHARLSGKTYDPNSVSFFSTHPATGARVEQAIDAARRTGQQPRGAARNVEAYMRAIDGMIYGDSPDQGYARDGAFWHPDLGFAFTAPDGWEIKNTPKAVGVVGPDGESLAVLDAGQSQGQPLQALLADMMGSAGNVSAPQPLTINGLPAVTATGTGAVQGKPARIRAVLIDAGERIYRFRMVATAGNFERNDAAFESLARSFRRIGPGQAPPPLRIRTRQVFGGETVASLAAQTGFSDAREDRFRVMNGLAAGQEVRPGQWVKLVQ